MNDSELPLDDPLYQMRHSAAHVLAQAVLDMFPEAKLGVGPVIEHGFYYDFLLPRTLIPEDLAILEQKMKKIQKEAQKFVRQETDPAMTVEFLKKADQPFKVELAEEFAAEGKQLTFYENVNRKGDVKFVDLCRGGHTETTKSIGYFKLNKIAGAYWRGDEKRPQLQRIYGLLFAQKDELKAHMLMLEEAKKRDHRKLGEELNIFTISDLVGAGLPLLKPNGMAIRHEVETYLWDLHRKRGYLRVWTPHIAKMALYETSGHAAKFGAELFRVSGAHEGDDFCMKPMNCPHHMQIFSDNHWSYRDMPVRYFEPATVYRNEKSGQLSGLTRVRAISQDDGHLFCRKDQIADEVKTIVEIIQIFFGTLGMGEDYWISLSVRDPEDMSKYLGEPETWDMAEGALEDILKNENLPYKRVEGEAAFYGPKLDFMFKDAIGREWQLSTIQLDFNLPERFNLSYINENNEKERPVVIHRAISGSLERFMGVMIEHFAGAFPTWLAPTQAILLPVSDKFIPYCEEVRDILADLGVRVKIDDASESLGKKIRNAEKSKIPWMLVIGEKEVAERKIAARSYHSKEQSDFELDAFVEMIADEIKNRSLPKV
ncbi:threonine--tRNA ligase [Candidatus Peregrinibacteria bacterium]|jgi:threonyl-tRNA synthetase|nr:threonine--tRNA ligase [Candidatus Peregrinibacteria bacterium]MBT4631506.1 threonine--tRNA ligase [Candidatus Peregrinibacteria bacterium]MBT5517293.1 threonine--tRNA ligase [Candidatus Peregrinibacteria bacterium]MBT5823895.1 threonine--tRNA ligase [Candidatus Peregrinibacteria bacterium]